MMAGTKIRPVKAVTAQWAPQKNVHSPNSSGQQTVAAMTAPMALASTAELYTT